MRSNNYLEPAQHDEAKVMSNLSSKTTHSNPIRDGTSEGRRDEFASFTEVYATAEKEAAGTQPYQCRRCLRMKRECDGALPKCSHCATHGMLCKYEDRERHQSDAHTQASLLSTVAVSPSSPTQAIGQLVPQQASFIPEPDDRLLSPLQLEPRPPPPTTPARAKSASFDIDEELNVKFLGSFSPLGIPTLKAPTLKTPLLRYEFHSAATSPVLRPRIEPSEPVNGSLVPTQEGEYMYLGIKPSQVRLLLLSKGQGNDAIHCSLQTVESKDLVQSTLVYQALSYAWGPEDEHGYHILIRDIDVTISHDINIKDRDYLLSLVAPQVIPRRFPVRSNLYLALKRLRSATEDLWLWVDAVCINQASDSEKTHQLSKMLSIYSSAQNVCIWIGEDGASQGNSDMPAGTAMGFVPSIINLTVLERIISGQIIDEKVAQSCRAFAELLKRPWFGRRWVIQEVSGARHASIQSGTHRMNWIDFADAVELFTANIEAIRAMYNKSDTAKTYPDALRHVESAGAKAIVSSTNNVLRKARDGKIVDRPLDIESLVMAFIHFDVSNPRDTIYALLALASDGQFSSAPRETPSLLPDYTKSPAQVYMEFVRHCFVAKESLDIICRNWALPIQGLSFRWAPQFARKSPDSLVKDTGGKIFPSWIGLVSNSAYGPPSRFTGRFNGDSLVGEPGRPVYKASRGSRMDVRFGEQEAKTPGRTFVPELNGILHVAGIIIGQVSRATSRVVDGTISDDCLEMMGWHQDDDVNMIPDRLWRTLVADRDSNGQPPPLWYRRACMYCLKNTTAEGDLNTAKLLENRSLPGTVLQFLRRVQAVVWSRKFLVCRDVNDESSQLFGLGSRYAKEGDIVCILYGCSVPVLLRALGGDQYGLVGECYIHGKMDGEATMRPNDASIKHTKAVFDII